jgi:serine/threonine protein kinase
MLDQVRPIPQMLQESNSVLPSEGPRLSTKDFKMIKELGKGSFGKVYHVVHNLTANHYALKMIRKAQIHQLKMVDQIKNEIEIMQILQHPNIVKLHTYFEDPPTSTSSWSSLRYTTTKLSVTCTRCSRSTASSTR